jgi:hypothetical protein
VPKCCSLCRQVRVLLPTFPEPATLALGLGPFVHTSDLKGPRTSCRMTCQCTLSRATVKALAGAFQICMLDAIFHTLVAERCVPRCMEVVLCWSAAEFHARSERSLCLYSDQQSMPLILIPDDTLLLYHFVALSIAVNEVRLLLERFSPPCSE